MGLLRLREALQLRAMLSHEWGLARSSAAAIYCVYRTLLPPLSPALAVQAALLGKIEVFLTGKHPLHRSGHGGREREGNVGSVEAALRALSSGQRLMRLTFGAQHRSVLAVERSVSVFLFSAPLPICLSSSHCHPVLPISTKFKQNSIWHPCAAISFKLLGLFCVCTRPLFTSM